MSILAGLISVMPNLVFINSDDYQGLPIMGTDAESLYLSRINGVYKGCIYNCNPYIKEYNNVYPHFNSSLSESIVAIYGIITHTPIVVLKVFYEFLLLSILYFLVYFLVFRLTNNILISLLGACFIVFGYNLLNTTDLINIPDILELIRFKTDYTQFLIFSRPINPQFSSVFFFLYLHVLLSAISTKSKKWFLMLAITYGLSFYIYFFTYAFATVVQGVWIGVYAIRKQWKTMLSFAVATLLGLLIATPIFIQILKLFNHPFYSTIPTYYLLRTHIPDISFIGIVLLLLFIITSILYFKKFKTFSNQSYFVAVLISACFITRNEHIVSGMIMQYNHFEMYLFSPIFVIGICFCTRSFIGDVSLQKHKYIILFLISFTVFNASLIQYRSYKHWLPYSLSTQKHISVLEWTKDNLSDSSVISAPEPLANYIPYYTRNYVLWTEHAGQWISIPGRKEDYDYSRTSQKALEEIGKKYNIDYYVEERKNDLLAKSKKRIVYVDEYFVVYKAD